MSERLWNWIARATCPGYRLLWTGPKWKRSLGSWYLGWWGWCFYYSNPWRPGSFDEGHGA